MLPWTRSKWFRLAVTGFSTLFVAVVLATSLMAEGSALKRAEVEYDEIDCKRTGEAKGRARPAQGCKRKKRVVIPIKDGAAISKDDLERALDEMPRLQGRRGRAPRWPGRARRAGRPRRERVRRCAWSQGRDRRRRHPRREGRHRRG